MVDSNEYFGNFIKGEDVNDPMELTISDVKPVVLNEGDRAKLVVNFEETPKGLVLNKTNNDRIVKVLETSETEEWIGKQITLTTEKASFKGKESEVPRVQV